MCKWWKDNAFKDRAVAHPASERRKDQPEKHSEFATELALDPRYNGEDEWDSGEWSVDDLE